MPHRRPSRLCCPRCRVRPQDLFGGLGSAAVVMASPTKFATGAKTEVGDQLCADLGVLVGPSVVHDTTLCVLRQMLKKGGQFAIVGRIARLLAGGRG